VQNIRFLDGVMNIAKDLGVPALIEPENVILADEVEIILILRNDEIINIKVFDKLIKNLFISELNAVDKQHTRVKEIVSRNANDLFGIGAVFVYLHHRLLVTSAYVAFADVGREKLADITLNDRVAVNIDSLVVHGEHFGDKESVIGRF
jgi:hypothetical protein